MRHSRAAVTIALMWAAQGQGTATTTFTMTHTLPSATATFTETQTLPTATMTATATSTATMTLPSETSTMTMPTATETATSTSSQTMTSTLSTTHTASATATSTNTMTLPSATMTMTHTLPSMTSTATLPSMTSTISMPTATSTSTFTLPTETSTGTMTLPTSTQTMTLPTSTQTYTETDDFCPNDPTSHFRRIEYRGQIGTGPYVGRFLLPGTNPGRIAFVRCLQARVSKVLRGLDYNNCTVNPWVTARVVYAFAGQERADYCSKEASGEKRDDCGDAPKTALGACVYARKGSEDIMTDEYEDTCVQIGKRDGNGAGSPSLMVNTWSTANNVHGDLVASHDLLHNGARAGDNFWFKSHGKSPAHFFLEYQVHTNAQCQWKADVSFVAAAQNPADKYCFSPEDVPTSPAFNAPPLTTSQVTSEGQWAENITNFNFDVPAALEKHLPRPDNFKYFSEERLISSQNKYTWVLGRGPNLDIDCLHLHSTAYSLNQSVNSTTNDWNGNRDYQCMDSQYGHNGMVNDGWMREFDEHHPRSSRQEQWQIKLIDAFDCSAFVNKNRTGTAGPTLEALKTTTFKNQGFDCDAQGNCLWEQCCSQQSKTNCEGIVSATVTGKAQCLWVESTGTCLPAVGMSSIDVKPQVGVDGKFSYVSSIASQPLSSYVMMQDQVTKGFFGDSNRLWLLQYTNAYGSAAQPCTQCVAVGFKSTVHGGICEPAGRQLCDARADRCTESDVATWPRFWAIQSGSSLVSQLYTRKFRTCNCLKEKEVCYRNIGCTSTKRYQLVLQNCLQEGCGDYCNVDVED